MHVQLVNKIANYLGTTSYKIGNNEKVVQQYINNHYFEFKILCAGKESTGLVAGIIILAEQGSREKYDKAQQFLIYQWIEFASQYGENLKQNSTNARTILKEINNYLQNCSYLVGFTITLADCVIYHLVYDILESLSPLEREPFLDLCRWFNHIQQDESVRQNNKIINFSSTYITSKQTTGY